MAGEGSKKQRQKAVAAPGRAPSKLSSKGYGGRYQPRACTATPSTPAVASAVANSSRKVKGPTPARSASSKLAAMVAAAGGTNNQVPQTPQYQQPQQPMYQEQAGSVISNGLEDIMDSCYVSNLADFEAYQAAQNFGNM